MKLYYSTSEGETFLLESDNYQEINKYIYSYVSDVLKFKSYYMRKWMADETTAIVDYGSHVNFFVIKDATQKELFEY